MRRENEKARTVKYLKGGVITIPKRMRDQLGWGPGTELVAERLGDEVILTRKPEITDHQLSGLREPETNDE